MALIAFMPTKGNGAIGSLEFTAEERKTLALKSIEAPPKYGNAERQKLINEVLFLPSRYSPEILECVC